MCRRNMVIWGIAFFVVASSLSGCTTPNQTLSQNKKSSMPLEETESISTESELSTEYDVEVSPDTFSYLTGKKHADFRKAQLAEKKDLMSNIDITKYVVIPDLKIQKIKYPEKTDPDSKAVIDRIKGYAPSSSIRSNGELSTTWLSEISGDTVLTTEEAVKQMTPVTNRAFELKRDAQIYSSVLSQIWNSAGDRNYIDSIPNEMIEAYTDYYKNHRQAYADKLEMSLEDFNITYAKDWRTMNWSLREDAEDYMKQAFVAEYILNAFGVTMTDEDYEKSAFDMLAYYEIPVIIPDDMNDFQIFQIKTGLKEMKAVTLIADYYSSLQRSPSRQ